MVVAAFLHIGCVGETAIAYKGTVTADRIARHSFDDEPNPDQNTHIPDARVSLYVKTGEVSCGAEPGREERTDSYGHFEMRNVVFGGTPFADNKITICVEHPEYESYEYRTIHYKTKDPEHAEKYLNITLKKRTP